MRVQLDPDVKVQVTELPPGPKAAVRKALAILDAHDGDRPPALDVKRLGREGIPTFRIRVGTYRIVYARFAQAHRVLKVFHRSEGYGWLERLG